VELVMAATSDTLLLISIALYEGRLSLCSIWATSNDLRAGHRRTDLEEPPNVDALLARLSELVPRLFGRDPGFQPAPSN
jgi:hypothetical protein